jgi:hypothetical protein
MVMVLVLELVRRGQAVQKPPEVCMYALCIVDKQNKKDRYDGGFQENFITTTAIANKKKIRALEGKFKGI